MTTALGSLALVSLLAGSARTATVSVPATTPTPVYINPVWRKRFAPDPAQLRSRCAKFKPQGVPVVEAQLLKSGKMGEIKTVRSCGCPAGDQLLIDTIRTWDFAPATRDGKPVDATLTLSVNHYWW